MGRSRLGVPVLLLSGVIAQGRAPGSGFLSALAPDHARAQFAGAAGLLSLGAGYGFWDDRVEAGLMYGFVPEWLGGATIQTLAQRTSLSPILWKPRPGWSLHPLSAGYAAHVALGSNYDLLLEKKFRGYYWPSALHLWMFAGTRARKDFPSRRILKGISAQAEIGTLDAYLRPWLRNESIDFRDVLSLSLGLQAHFRP